MCENDVFVLPVNILTGVARRLLGPHDTLPCVLIWVFEDGENHPTICNNLVSSIRTSRKYTRNTF